MIDAAIVLAAGLGTRLAPLSQVRAKAALPVAGEVLIRRQLRWLAAAGVRRAVVNLHHLPATITARVGHGDDLGVEVRYSWEPVVLGSAGGPRRAFDVLDAERAFIVNGDMITDVDLGALAQDHDHHRPLVTMAGIAALPGYNALVVGADGALAGVERAGTTVASASTDRPRVHFIGVQVAERRAFAAVDPHRPSETLKGHYPRLLAATPAAVRVWTSAASYHDIGAPADYLATVTTLARAEGHPLDQGAGARIAPGADVRDSVLWDDVVVETGATVHGCVLADGVRVPGDARLVRAAVIRRVDAHGDLPGAPLGDLWVTPVDGPPA